MPATALRTKKRSSTLKPKRVITPAPTAWNLVTKPVVGAPGLIEPADISSWDYSTLPGRYRDLKTWADKNKVEISPSDFTLVRYNDWSEVFVWTKFTLTKKITPRNDRVFGAFKCSCGESLSIGAVFCSSCSTFQACSECFISGSKLHGVEGTEARSCSRCAKECKNASCNNLVSGSAFTECVDCCPRAACTLCATIHQESNLKSHKKAKLCKDCKDKICFSCDEAKIDVQPRKFKGTTSQICSPCVDKLYQEERKSFEKWATDELPTSGSLVIPSSNERPIRTISIETEFDGSSDKAARALFQAGLISAPNKQSYSAQGETGKFPCILKSDSTVSGGELVSYLLDLDNANHAAALLRMTEVMRGVREMGYAQFSSKAGGHIHIDLHGFGISDCWAYYTVCKFLEMPLYYLAGAGADYGHRSLAGNSYGNPPSVGPFGTKKSFMASVRGLGRTGISLNNYMAGASRCACGAYGVSEWKDCTCNLGKATSEWRLWNAEITPRILHAWIAIMMSVTAFASDMDEVDESQYPYLEWKKKKFELLQTKDKQAIKERLEWMHTELPLTHDERDSIIYAAKKSELIGLGERYLNGLISLESNSNFSSKTKPRNPSSRKAVSFTTK